MECPTITDLKLDKNSLEGLDRIRKNQALSNALATTIGVTVFATTVSTKSAIETSYNIMSNEWELFALSMRAIPSIARERLKQEAALQILDHAKDSKQKQFWTAIYEGCSIK